MAPFAPQTIRHLSLLHPKLHLRTVLFGSDGQRPTLGSDGCSLSLFRFLFCFLCIYVPIQTLPNAYVSSSHAQIQGIISLEPSFPFRGRRPALVLSVVQGAPSLFHKGNLLSRGPMSALCFPLSLWCIKSFTSSEEGNTGGNLFYLFFAPSPL